MDAAARVEEILHAELGASSAARWMACPGSVRLARELPVTAERSWYAAEGTAAHAIGERCLRQGTSPFDYLGEEIFVEGFDTPFEVTDEMAEAVALYVAYCRATLCAPNTETHGFEARVGLAPLAAGRQDPLHAMFGTADFFAYNSAAQCVTIVDYKHGAGVPVEAHANPQPRYYALGAVLGLLERGYRVRRIRTVIIQPRAPHPDGAIREERLRLGELFDWADELITAAWRAFDDDAPLISGAHCRFCPAAGVCPALRDASMARAKLVFDAEGGVAEQERRTVAQLTVDELSEILDAAEQIKAWLEAVRARAHALLTADHAVPGYKLVPKRAQRQWRDARLALTYLRQQGIDNEQLYKQTPISPAQAEKLLKGEARKALRQYVESVSSGTTLAPATDTRPAAAPSIPSAQAVFSASHASHASQST